MHRMEVWEQDILLLFKGKDEKVRVILFGKPGRGGGGVRKGLRSNVGLWWSRSVGKSRNSAAAMALPSPDCE